MSIIGAACGRLFRDSFQLPAMAGIATLMGVIAVLVYFGNSLVERALSYWAIVLYALYGSLGLWCLLHYAHPVWSNLQKPVENSRWVTGGLRYAGYNLAAVPGVLFCIRHLSTRREAVIAGLLCGPIAIIPAALFYVALIAFYPSIIDEPVPSIYILSRVGSRCVAVLFQIALFVTLAKTGAGVLHAFNERVATALYQGRQNGSELYAIGYGARDSVVFGIYSKPRRHNGFDCTRLWLPDVGCFARVCAARDDNRVVESFHWWANHTDRPSRLRSGPE
jgi:uncharacterized membrane protein YkvI